MKSSYEKSFGSPTRFWRLGFFGQVKCDLLPLLIVQGAGQMQF